MDDLWTIASDDHDSFAREGALARAEAELEGLMPFLLASRSEQEFGHRIAAAHDSIGLIAARTGMEPDEIEATARRRYELYREALMEDTDPMISLEPLLNGGGYGQGPEKPDAHTEGPDFSGGYSEVPAGPPGGPDPQVTMPRQQPPGPVQQATGSLRGQAGADPGSAMMSPYTPPDMGTGPGSVDVGLPAPGSGGMTPSIPAGMPAAAPVGAPTSQPGVTSTASRDPVRSKVLRVTAMIAEANPGLPRGECERLGRRVVASYLREADLTDSVMGNGPMTDSGSSGGGSGSGGGTGLPGHVLEWQGAKSMMKGMGGGADAAGAGAGAAGEAASVLGDAAELAPLLAV
jgi:hypothetical protein